MYNERANKSAQRYKNESQKRIEIAYRKVDYESDIEPYIRKSGMPAATFIKTAIAEYISRMQSK